MEQGMFKFKHSPKKIEEFNENNVKILKLGLPPLWRPITSCENLWLR
jgi:hypothetical protein